MRSLAVKRMIFMFEATGCLNHRPRSGQLGISANAARPVQEEMEIVAGLSTHGEVRARENARLTGVPCTLFG